MSITAARNADSSHAKKGDAPSYRVGGAVLLAFACLSVALGVPRLIGGLFALSADQTVSNLLTKEPATIANLDAAAADLANAGRWSGDGVHKLNRGIVLLHRALIAPNPQERTERLAEAERETAAGLAIAPGEPGPWARLAWLRQQRGDFTGAVAALRLSLLSGSFTPVMMMSRLELALSLQSAMNDEMRSLLRQQLRLTWIVDPNFIAKLAEQPDTAPLVHDALAELSEQEIARYLELHGVKR